MYLKRDDATSSPELAGNKLRKLEFLLAAATQSQADTVVTIGGVQSNHCRATCCAARLLGLHSAVVLRCSDPENDADETTGNLLFMRAAGARLFTVSAAEYGRVGSTELVNKAAKVMREEGNRTYSIPVGGSNAVGTWGYVEAAREFKQQYDEDASLRSIKHIVFATGSGGTAAGLTLGLVHAFGDDCPDLVAVGVCDNVDYFYKFQAGIIADMGYAEGDVVKAEAFLRDKLTIINGRGRGYAEVPTADEMAFARDFATSSGVIVDGVYTGKAVYNFFKEVENGRVDLKGAVMFWHTGGQLGAYAQAEGYAEGWAKPARLNL